MAPKSGVILCLAYISGLLLYGLPLGEWAIPFTVAGVPIPIVSGLFLLGGSLGAIGIARWWRRGPRPTLWLVAGLVAALAAVHLAWRTPVPGRMDISHLLNRVATIGSTQVLEGRIVSADPQINRRLKGRFLMGVEHLQVLDEAGEVTFQVPVGGRSYVTAPLLQVTGLHQGQRLRVQGELYIPQAALNPNSFDFRQHLAQRHTFSGFVAREVTALEPPPWGLWQLRQRIVRSHVEALGSPWGQVVSAMALGRRAVDLPFTIQDLFTQVGLAHTVAASGFHVSLLLGTVLTLARSQSTRLRVGLGGLILLGYITLTGPQASVIRAALMGAAALSGMASDRKVNPLGALLVAITVMLLWNPTWIGDIGFQLSVAATFGLIVTVPALMQRLDWLPIPIAGLLAVPTAATLWVIPLLLFHFNTLSLVSVGLSALTTPLVMVISLGGMVSGAIALISPALGSLVAWPLIYPVQLLLALAQGSQRIPGSAIAVGQLALWQLVILYGLMILAWRYPPLQKRPGWVALGLLLLTLGPIWGPNLTQTRITLLAAGGNLLWVQQHRGHTAVISTGDDQTAFYTTLPFLKQGGMNRIDAAIAPAIPNTQDASDTANSPVPGWTTLLTSTSIQNFYSPVPNSPLSNFSGQYHPLSIGNSTPIANLNLQFLGTENPIFRLTAAQHEWLFLPTLDLDTQNYLAQGAASVLPSSVLIWPGNDLSESLLTAIQPTVALCYGRFLPESLENQLRQRGIQVHWTERDGAISWTRSTGFRNYQQQFHRPQLLD